MDTNAPLLRAVATTCAALVTSLVAAPIAGAAETWDPAQPRADFPDRSMRVAPATPATVGIPITVTEPVRVDVQARGATGRVRLVEFLRAGTSRVGVPLHRPAPLVRAFDRGRAVPLSVQVVVTDADGNRHAAATSVRLRAPRGYLASHRMVTPVRGYPITSGFGPRWGRQHQGVDIPAPTGTPIHATRAGTVTRVGHDGGYGLSTTIDHGPYSTMYAHQSSASVRPGQRVARGAVIGRIGSTGSSTGAHLHFEVHVRGTARDPMNWLG